MSPFNLLKATSLFYVVYATAAFITRPLSGRLLDRRGANIVVYPTFLLFALGLFLMGAAKSSLTLLVAGALIGFGYGNFATIAQALVLKGVETHRLGVATSTYFVFLDFGLGLGPYLLGFLVPFVSYRGIYYATAGIILFAALLYIFLYDKPERRAQDKTRITSPP